LYLRLAVVAQVAAIERETWMQALRRSWALTERNVLRIAFFVVCIGLIGLLPTLLIRRPFVHHPTSVPSFAVGVGVQVLVLSFTALATALLYFDLRARREAHDEKQRADGSRASDGGISGSSELDPRRYSDASRPKGWYVDPEEPKRMRYWDTSTDPPAWRGRARASRAIRRRWRSEQERA
jgi:hypothetical protein